MGHVIYRGWPLAELIRTRRLTLEPLRVEHADEMTLVLADEDLYEFIGGRPPELEELRERYARQITGPADGQQGWLNWIIRHRESGGVLGTVQATVHDDAGAPTAEISWVVAVSHQHRGYAREAATGLVEWLRGRDVRTFVAHIHPYHAGSIGVAEHLGMEPSDVTVDGEVRWISRCR